MKQVLTGIQSSGKPHLGNIIGAILPALKLGRMSERDPFYFVADLHSLTTFFDAAERKKNVLSVAAAWLAFGAEERRAVIYRQSKIPLVNELTWYLSCFTPYGLLGRAHSFKDKSENLSEVNAGLFTYPVLMAADMLLYEASHVPVGKDQKQHIEITRDIANAFNYRYGNIFTMPEPIIDENTMTIPGIDGRKMSKSYKNYIDIFQSDGGLKKSVLGIVTDSAGVSDKKDPKNCNVFKLYQAIEAPEKVADMHERYEAGGYGYGDAKKELFASIKEKFGEQRAAYDRLMANSDDVEAALEVGEEKARRVAEMTIAVVRKTLGFD